MVYQIKNIIFALQNQLTNTKIMKSNDKTNTLIKKGQSMTLRAYYKSLPEPTFPKRDFIQEIANKCNVSLTTANNWIKYGIKPNNPEHVHILSEMTGIAPEKLWIE